MKVKVTIIFILALIAGACLKTPDRIGKEKFADFCSPVIIFTGDREMIFKFQELVWNLY